jgi:hypothetical protein
MGGGAGRAAGAGAAVVLHSQLPKQAVSEGGVCQVAVLDLPPEQGGVCQVLSGAYPSSISRRYRLLNSPRCACPAKSRGKTGGGEGCGLG